MKSCVVAREFKYSSFLPYKMLMGGKYDIRDEYKLRYFEEGGLVRRKCEKCGSFFWTRDARRRTCGDTPCEPYSFIENPPLKEKNVDEMREAFLSFFERHGHKRLKRYPVVARWRDDIYLTIASIADFQPHVTSGEVPPPANPLVISQPCIRLEDLEAIGHSGRHLTIFEMMAHHAFNKQNEEIYWKDETVRYCDEFLSELGADLYEVTYKEEPWAGGGNAGPCVEVILRGLELATLVFMNLELATDGDIEIKGERYRKMESYIVDTGYGLERFVWASKGTPTVYDAIFPEVIDELASAAGVDVEGVAPLMKEVSRFLGVTTNKKELAKFVGASAEELMRKLKPLELIYSVSDHTKCLAFMLGDGIVPSNAKEGYLARLVLRRCLRMLKVLGVGLPLEELVLKHIKLLRRSFPELEERADDIVEILSLEKTRYEETLARGERLLERLLRERKKMTTETLVNLYDTHGVPPELVCEVAARRGVTMEIPENFYSLVASMHSSATPKIEKDPLVREIRRRKLPETEKLYYKEPKAWRFEAEVLDFFDGWLVLDRTLFYPEGGGQPSDVGMLRIGDFEFKVSYVRSADGVILHKIEPVAGNAITAAALKGASVVGEINFRRRLSLMRHHSATHIILDAARKVLGKHVWQAGAQKGEQVSRIDITHFKRISDEERRRIEQLANEVVMRNLPIKTEFIERNEAEQKYGFRIYQGGVPGGKFIRIVEVGDDVEACAGTHCEFTGEIGAIKILRTERIQDGVERIEFSAGEAAISSVQELERILKEAANAFRVPYEVLPQTARRFFEEWKQLRREVERLQSEMATLRIESIKGRAKEISGETGVVKVVSEKVEAADVKELVKLAASLSAEGIVAILASESRGRASAVVAVPKPLTARIKAGDVVKIVCEILGGGGGGSPELAQGGGQKPEMLDVALKKGVEFIKSLLSLD